MNRKIFLVSLLGLFLLVGTAGSGTSHTPSPVEHSISSGNMVREGMIEEEIEESIDAGLAWLVAQQDDEGYWGPYTAYWVPYTGFALIKLQDRAYELGYDSPFDPEYGYASTVIAGWDFIFSTNSEGLPYNLFTQTLTVQDHISGASGTLDDPDTNGNGYGIYFNSYGHYHTYSTGVMLMALEASGTPDRSTGIDIDGDGIEETFFDIAQDAADWLAFAQGDAGHDEGGWFYTTTVTGTPVSYPTGGYIDTDNSNGGYAVLGLAAAEGFGCTVPIWVKTELSVWINVLQDAVDGDMNDGGSWYRPEWAWVNLLKTGNLVFEMSFVGDAPTTQRFQDALDYIERHWNDATTGSINDVGWKDPTGLHHHYQAMYCLMKGFEYSLVELIDVDGDNVPEHDWYLEFAQVLIASQTTDGYWTGGAWGDNILNTIWALLTLERITPPPPVIEVYIDVKPHSWPNPLNHKSRGVFPVAICGTEEFDVMTIDPATVRLTMLDADGEVTPLRWHYEDVATPYMGEEGGGHACGADGYMDLVFHFRTPEVFEILHLYEYTGEAIPLVIIGALFEEEGGTAISGADFVWILQVPRKGKP
ncbi:MAG: hypothetical protein GWO20_03245 [Candidatus Korarchaeota archaeon]|nr:hypothetical protein [Candidatus Korarchaeota archaeon]NIU82500.1 hypothetical protein [Candidatus Thorarchaeota archaeon]NIW12988.1 hypothetical protein [Candidatus Thorarchaeota archaeon]NIW51138.1 hypothetical protein [Candidatus Korarchaeota archaeon]